MKYVWGMYILMAMMVVVTLASEFIFDGEYSAIASWAVVMLFFFGSIFFANARYYLPREK
ncbi:hypothetical protein [Halobacillus salinus]|uniref:hypothetical protein n=1 Tax=Halobacillus salinus TaxID=192814 RepID=UPI0009A89CB6|nr:hypothetical protein [Halobacillus salinus]